jgi:hypothetical protein
MKYGIKVVYDDYGSLKPLTVKGRSTGIIYKVGEWARRIIPPLSTDIMGPFAVFTDCAQALWLRDNIQQCAHLPVSKIRIWGCHYIPSEDRELWCEINHYRRMAKVSNFSPGTDFADAVMLI